MEPYRDNRGQAHPNPRNFGSALRKTVSSKFSEKAFDLGAEPLMHRSQADFYHMDATALGEDSGTQCSGRARRRRSAASGTKARREPDTTGAKQKIAKSIEELESELTKSREKQRAQKSPIAEIFGGSPKREHRGKSADSDGKDKKDKAQKREGQQTSNFLGRDLPANLKLSLRKTEESIVYVICKNGVMIPHRLREEIAKIFEALSETIKGTLPGGNKSQELESAISVGLKSESYKRMMRPVQEELEKLQQALEMSSRVVWAGVGRMDAGLANVRANMRSNVQPAQTEYASKSYAGLSRKNRSNSQAGIRVDGTAEGSKIVAELQGDFKRLVEEMKKKELKMKEWTQLTIRKDMFAQQLFEKAVAESNQRMEEAELSRPQAHSEELKSKEELIKKLQVELDTAQYFLKRKKSEEAALSEKQKSAEANFDTLCARVGDFMKSMQRLQRGVAREEGGAIPKLKEDFEARKRDLAEAIRGSHSRNTRPVALESASASKVSEIRADPLSSTVPSFQPRTPDQGRHSEPKYIVKVSDSFEQRLDNLEREKSKVDKELAKYMVIASEQSKELTQNRQKFEECMEMVKDQTAVISEMKKRNAGLEEESKHFVEENRRLSRDNERLTTDLGRLMQENKDLFAETRRLIEENERLECVHDFAPAEGDSSALTMTQKLVGLRPVSDVKSTIRAAAGRFEEWALKSYQSVIARLQGECDRTLTAGNSMKVAVMTARKRYRSSLRENASAYEANILKYKAALSRLQAEKAGLTKKLGSSGGFRQELDAIRAKIHQKCKEIDLTLAATRTTQAELTKAKAEFLTKTETECAQQQRTDVVSRAQMERLKEELLKERQERATEAETMVARADEEANERARTAREEDRQVITRMLVDGLKTILDAGELRWSRISEKTEALNTKADTLAGKLQSLIPLQVAKKEQCKTQNQALILQIRRLREKNTLIVRKLRPVLKLAPLKSAVLSLSRSVKAAFSASDAAIQSFRQRASEFRIRDTVSPGEKEELITRCKDLEDRCEEQRRALGQQWESAAELNERIRKTAARAKEAVGKAVAGMEKRAVKCGSYALRLEVMMSSVIQAGRASCRRAEEARSRLAISSAKVRAEEEKTRSALKQGVESMFQYADWDEPLSQVEDRLAPLSAKVTKLATMLSALRNANVTTRNESNSCKSMLTSVLGQDSADLTLTRLCERVRAVFRRNKSAEQKAKTLISESMQRLAGDLRIRVATAISRLQKVEELGARINAVKRAVKARGGRLSQTLQEKELAAAQSRGGYEDVINQMKADAAENVKAVETECEGRIASIQEESKRRIEAAEKRLRDEISEIIKADGTEALGTEELVRRLGQKVEEGARLKLEIEELKTKTQDMQNALNEKAAKNAELDSKAQELQLALSGKEAEIAAKAQDLCKALEEKEAENSEQSSKTMQELSAKEAEISAMRDTLEKNKAESAELGEKMRRLQAALEGREADIKKRQEEDSKRIAELEAEAASSKETVSKLSHENEELLKGQIPRLEQDLAAAKKQLEAFRSESGEKEKKLQSQFGDAEGLRTELAKLTEESELSQAEYHKLEGENQQLQGQLAALTSALKGQNGENEKLMEEKEQLSKQCLRGTADLENAKADARVLQDQLKTKEVEIADLNDTITAKTNQYRILVSERGSSTEESFKLRQDNEGLRQKISELEAIGMKCRQEIERLNADTQRLNEQVRLIFAQKDVGEVTDIPTGIRKLIEYYESTYKELEQDKAEFEAAFNAQKAKEERTVAETRTAILKILNKDTTEELNQIPLDQLFPLLARVCSPADPSSGGKDKAEILSLTALLKQKGEEVAAIKEQAKAETHKQSEQLEEMATASNKKDVMIQQTQDELRAVISKAADLFGLEIPASITAVEYLDRCKAKVDSDINLAAQKFKSQLDDRDREIDKLNAQVSLVCARMK